MNKIKRLLISLGAAFMAGLIVMANMVKVGQLNNLKKQIKNRDKAEKELAKESEKIDKMDNKAIVDRLNSAKL
jgi:hypothetical protein